MTFLRYLAILGIACAARDLPAQLSPRVSGSVLIGPTSIGGSEFRLTDGVMLAAEGTVRLAARQHVALIGALSYDLFGSSGDVVSLCVPSARFGCAPTAAGFQGVDGRLGLEVSLGTSMLVQATTGTGWYRYNNPNTATQVDRGAHVIPIVAEASFLGVPHVSPILRLERVHFRDFMGDPFDITAGLFGLRLH